MTALLHPPPARHRRPRPTAVPPAPKARPGAARPTPGQPSRRRAGLVAGAVLFATVLAGNVGVHASTTQGQFELERLRDSARQREATYQQLRLRVAEQEAPERIMERARQLGMIEPAKVTYLTPTAQTSTGEHGAGTTAPDAPAEAAQGWGQVKPHLDGRR